MRRYNTIIIGSGAAAYNCADSLYELGVTDIAIFTEGRNLGTSRNTGSDKQTYYKLSLASDGSDSVYEMASTLFEGGCVDGDVCMVEAANSLKSFLKLCFYGVPFPTNEYGEYVGYKTDHDPRQRATSIGPLTSKKMTECLEKKVFEKKIKFYDGYYVTQLLCEEKKVKGIIAINQNNYQKDFGIEIFECNNIVLATGGCSCVYYNSVYPLNHTGTSSLAIEAGAEMSNMSEWQYGLASTKFRWNVSGTYQQVLPKYISVDNDGNEREFLLDYFNTPQEALNNVFLKGYQWPFDSKKINGSSIIDLVIYNEINILGNRVFMDFQTNPKGLNDGFERLSEECYNYLKNSKAAFGTPIQRLQLMNAKAIQLYKDNGIDLYKEPLEVAVCSQHINGGVYVDINYETTIKGLYACGEVAGTFGITRPGGSALNSGQVGGLRISEAIKYKNLNNNEEETFKINSSIYINKLKRLIGNSFSSKSTIMSQREKIQKEMSKCSAFIRDANKIENLIKNIETELENFSDFNKIQNNNEIVQLLKNKDIILSALAVLNASKLQFEKAGSRGGAIYCEKFKFENGKLDVEIKPEEKNMRNFIFKVAYKDNKYNTYMNEKKPLKVNNDWFENVWKEYNIKNRIN